MLCREDRVSAKGRLLAFVPGLGRRKASAHEVPCMLQNDREALLPQIGLVGGREAKPPPKCGLRETMKDLVKRSHAHRDPITRRPSARHGFDVLWYPMLRPDPIAVGTAGWSLPKAYAPHFPEAGSHLERYAQRFSAVEINTSFYRPHRVSTYEKWAAAVPDGFRFAVKVPRAITHEQRLTGADELLARFSWEVAGLGPKLGPVLLQLPPSLAFDRTSAEPFLVAFRRRFPGDIVCEPRHATWLAEDVDKLLSGLAIARVAADPAPARGADTPGGWTNLVYYRLHGSPRMYHSAYEAPVLSQMAAHLHQQAAQGGRAWCIFDNTAEFAATGNALDTLALITSSSPCTP